MISPEYKLLLLAFFFRCVRFTMHQQRRSHFNDLEYSRLIKDRSKWCVKREDTLSNLPQVPGLSGLTQVLPKKPVTRPLSSAVNRNIQHQTSRLQVRAKSAHPRLLHSHKYVHTNVSTQQLEVCKLSFGNGLGDDLSSIYKCLMLSVLISLIISSVLVHSFSNQDRLRI